MTASYLTDRYIEQQVHLALSEDIGDQDLTAHLFSDTTRGQATLFSKEAGILCGQAWFEQCFVSLKTDTEFEWHIKDGEHFEADTKIATVHSDKQTLVTAERSALNFIQLLSGTATTTAQFVQQIAHTKAQLFDTRKTIPGLRLAQKYAVTCGGGFNHRLGLWDAIMIKENHLINFNSIHEAVSRARQQYPNTFVEVEVETFEQLESAIDAQPNRILLDNFSIDDLHTAVQLTRHRVPLEASGNVNMTTVAEIADTGVDVISCGALTKNIVAIDLSLLLS